MHPNHQKRSPKLMISNDLPVAIVFILPHAMFVASFRQRLQDLEIAQLGTLRRGRAAEVEVHLDVLTRSCPDKDRYNCLWTGVTCKIKRYKMRRSLARPSVQMVHSKQSESPHYREQRLTK